MLLLVGARPGEVLALRWADVDEKWRSITIRDKVEGERAIPLTTYVHKLIRGIPKSTHFRDGRLRQIEWVFSSPLSKTGQVAKPHQLLAQACKEAEIDGLTLHGLRRSFASLSEWLEIPAGVVAQIMGHKPSATAEKHYKVRPLDLLRVHHERIEIWILEQAKMKLDA